MQSNKSSTGAKIKIQSDNADLALNEVNFYAIYVIPKYNYNSKFLI